MNSVLELIAALDPLVQAALGSCTTVGFATVIFTAVKTCLWVRNKIRDRRKAAACRQENARIAAEERQVQLIAQVVLKSLGEKR